MCSSDVETLIATCDQTTATGVRDRAILLLLARLGLRASDILYLRIIDIDWQQATLSVRRKGRRCGRRSRFGKTCRSTRTLPR
ncbi:tyrosine-type recombinase/integrase [Bradyrhizobium sp. CCBAU 45321]|uniref:tyrosine-type recombinase/integrase n=1 Tax=Bradyrhizobium sp. CCBAU 45321 TaxID=1641878 RepID=UPI00230455F0|nr:tyrosine-type recombinase/integrase [Bradyrhizobium sp. CCBAU 45321]